MKFRNQLQLVTALTGILGASLLPQAKALEIKPATFPLQSSTVQLLTESETNALNPADYYIYDTNTSVTGSILVDVTFSTSVPRPALLVIIYPANSTVAVQNTNIPASTESRTNWKFLIGLDEMPQDEYRADIIVREVENTLVAGLYSQIRFLHGEASNITPPAPVQTTTEYSGRLVTKVDYDVKARFEKRDGNDAERILKGQAEAQADALYSQTQALANSLQVTRDLNIEVSHPNKYKVIVTYNGKDDPAFIPEIKKLINNSQNRSTVRGRYGKIMFETTGN